MFKFFNIWHFNTFLHSCNCRVCWRIVIAEFADALETDKDRDKLLEYFFDNTITDMLVSCRYGNNFQEVKDTILRAILKNLKLLELNIEFSLRADFVITSHNPPHSDEGPSLDTFRLANTPCALPCRLIRWTTDAPYCPKIRFGVFCSIGQVARTRLRLGNLRQLKPWRTKYADWLLGLFEQRKTSNYPFLFFCRC